VERTATSGRAVPSSVSVGSDGEDVGELAQDEVKKSASAAEGSMKTALCAFLK